LEKSTKRKEDGVGGKKKRRGREKKVGDGIFLELATGEQYSTNYCTVMFLVWWR
jgi:hypothetical protein